MKITQTITVILLALFPAILHAQKIVKGSGYVLTQQRETPEFTSIEVSGPIQVFISQGELQPLTVEADDNLFTYIKTEVKNKVLKAYIPENVKIKKYADLNILISLPHITGLSVALSGKIEGTELWKTENIELDASTTGKIKLHLNATSIKITETTSSNIELKGNTDSLAATLTTAAQLKAKELDAKTANLNLTTGANVEIQVTQKIQYNLTTGAKLIYKGSPLITGSAISSGAKLLNEK